MTTPLPYTFGTFGPSYALFSFDDEGSLRLDSYTVSDLTEDEVQELNIAHAYNNLSVPLRLWEKYEEDCYFTGGGRDPEAYLFYGSEEDLDNLQDDCVHEDDALPFLYLVISEESGWDFSEGGEHRNVEKFIADARATFEGCAEGVAFRWEALPSDEALREAHTELCAEADAEFEGD